MSSNGNNNWDVSYSIISFFERVLNTHFQVRQYTREKDILFHITKKDGTELKLLLVKEYILGLEAVLRAKDEFPEMDYIVTNANWNMYTKEANDYGLKNDIGVFYLNEFMSALHWDHPKKYHIKDDDGNKIYGYSSAS